MTTYLPSVLLAAIIAVSSPAVALGQESTSDALTRRIASLERQVADLEQRVRELEALVQAEPARVRPAKATGNWKDLANWRRLERGMTMDQVRALLGDAERVNAGAIFTTWHWGKFPNNDAEAQFDIDGRLHGWSEPRR